jgi:hypothetical protein
MKVWDALRFFTNRHGPRWLRNRRDKSVAYRILATFGAVLDALVEWLIQGSQARMPGQGTPTALPYIGRDRGYLRGHTQSNAIFAARLLGWREAWRRAGHPFELLRQIRGYLAPYGVKVRHVDNAGNWHTIEADGTEVRQHLPGSWDWDGNTAEWWRFWIILYPPADWQVWPAFWELDPTLWGGNLAGNGWTLGQQVTFALAEDLRAIVRQWKAQHAVCAWIVVAFDPESFNPTDPGTLPDGNWQYYTKGSPKEPARLTTARYWQGVS